MPTIIPTIGRKVWLFEGSANAIERFLGLGPLDAKQPYDATIVYVHGDGTVSLDATSHRGHREFITHVQLRDPAADGSDQHGAGESFATWMPYQVGQAKVAAPETPAQANAEQLGAAAGVTAAGIGPDTGGATGGSTDISSIGSDTLAGGADSAAGSDSVEGGAGESQQGPA